MHHWQPTSDQIQKADVSEQEGGEKAEISSACVFHTTKVIFVEFFPFFFYKKMQN